MECPGFVGYSIQFKFIDDPLKKKENCLGVSLPWRNLLFLPDVKS